MSVNFPVFLLLLVGVDDILHLVITDGLVCAIFHRELANTLCRATQLSGIAEHGSQGHVRIKYEQARLRLRVGDVTSALHQLAHDAALVLGWHRDFDVHDRLENGRVCLQEGLVATVLGSDLEGHG